MKEELDPFVDYPIVGQHAGHSTRQDPLTRSYSVEPLVRKVLLRKGSSGHEYLANSIMKKRIDS
jgi:hypothetical protein